MITAVDPDHLDIYGDKSAVVDGFLEFIHRIKPGGTLIAESKVAGLLAGATRAWLSLNQIDFITYGLDPGADVKINWLGSASGESVFTIRIRGEEYRVQWNIPGKYNAMNATAGMIAGSIAGAEPGCMSRALGEMRGIRRRFEIVHDADGLVVIDDYAHHPEEVRSVIAAAREHYAGRRITGVFQPHLYTRTRDFCRDFADALDGLDECVLVELYPAREEPIEGVSSEMILGEMKINNRWCVTKKELTEKLKDLDPEVLLFMGAGDLDRMIMEIITELKN